MIILDAFCEALRDDENHVPMSIPVFTYQSTVCLESEELRENQITVLVGINPS